MKIDVIFAVNPHHCPSKIAIQEWAKAALDNRSANANVVIKVVSTAEMTQLNATYRHKEKPTNVLSFPCQLPPPLRKNQLGDIAICSQVVEKEALEQKKSLDAHWAHMVVHGVLHLLGYDHEQEEQALIMEEIERTILQDCGFADPFDLEIHHV
jgi:probable rRNA maturation factor